VDVNAKRIALTKQSIERLVVSADDEIGLTEATLDIGVETHEPSGTYCVAGAIRQPPPKPFDEIRHSDKPLPRLLLNLGLELIGLDVDAPDGGYGGRRGHIGIAILPGSISR
jgi:hypothetical protein